MGTFLQSCRLDNLTTHFHLVPKSRFTALYLCFLFRLHVVMLDYWMEVSGQLHVPAALLRVKYPRIKCTRLRLVLRAALNGMAVGVMVLIPGNKPQPIATAKY
jgi:hypothetical protein